MKGVEKNIILRCDPDLALDLADSAVGLLPPRPATMAVERINRRGHGVIAIPFNDVDFLLWPIDPDAYRMA
jgi:hypothetical protein